MAKNINISTLYTQYQNDSTSLSKKDKMALYEAAKESYYNGEGFMPDFEFDALEVELGLENKAYVGTKHNPSFTEEHPYVMGSLSKVQIHEKNGKINWSEYFTKAMSFITKYRTQPNVIITPKFDGCSFEAYVKDGKVVSISTRGDGSFGKNLYNHLIKKVEKNLINDQVNGCDYTLRGEVLINKNIFTQKYSEFVNPRSFVSGILNREYSSEIEEMINDLSIVIYDIRLNTKNGWTDYDWDSFSYPDRPMFYYTYPELTEDNFEVIYNKFAEYREVCPFALDGIVIKPTSVYRINNTTEHRPDDCVAIKFVPMLQETEVVKIEWNLKKFGNLIPNIWVKPVYMDGKKVQKCSGSNYSNLLKKKVSVGSKVIMSLAGDIIPFLYKVTDTTNFSEDKMDIPTDIYTYVEGVNLKKALTEDEINECKFLNSFGPLHIDKIGPAIAKNIYDYMKPTTDETSDFFGESVEIKKVPNNVLYLSADDIYFGAGSGKTGSNCKKSFTDMMNNLTLSQIIQSCNFRFCGGKVASQIANYLTGEKYSFDHLAAKGYDWCKDENSDEMKEVKSILNHLGKTFDDFKIIKTSEEIEKENNQIPVILTGEPNNYKSKGEFLKLNPQYRLTGSWKEVKIVFTNSLESNTGKMKQARAKNIDIQIY